MRVRHTTKSGDDKIELQMTPMIDIVFQLLVFFVVSFRIAASEVDFDIKLGESQRAAEPENIDDTPPVDVYLTANDEGELEAISLGENFSRGGLAGESEQMKRSALEEMRSEVRKLVGDGTGPGDSDLEVEIDFDQHLHWRYAILALEYISHDLADKKIVPLVKKIKFKDRGQTPDSEVR